MINTNGGKKQNKCLLIFFKNNVNNQNIGEIKKKR